jgi:hypothetical protein
MSEDMRFAVFSGITIFPVNRGSQVQNCFNRVAGSVGSVFVETTEPNHCNAVVSYDPSRFTLKGAFPPGVQLILDTGNPTEAFEYAQWDEGGPPYSGPSNK